jgi:RHS repeat-associated protein
VLEEYSPGQPAAASYVFGNALISRAQGASRSYYLADGLGSIRALTDAGGSVTDRYLYDAFGGVLAHSGSSDSPYLFAGERFDSDLMQYYLRARNYDALTGRFDRRDPAEGAIRDPISLHDYLYARSNPTNFIDPSGMSTLLEKVYTFSVATILANVLTSAVVLGRILGVNGKVDGIICSLRTGLAARGLGGYFGADLAYDFKTNTVWAGAVAEFGAFPISLFNNFNKKISASFTAGLVFNMDSPKDLAGAGGGATWPWSVFKLIYNFTNLGFPQNKAWGLMCQLAKVSKSTRWTDFAVTFGFSSLTPNGAAAFEFGPRSNTFSWTFSYASEYVPLFQLPPDLKSLYKPVEEAVRKVAAFGNDIEGIVASPDDFLQSLFGDLPLQPFWPPGGLSI